jgi:hypothetical protein
VEGGAGCWFEGEVALQKQAEKKNLLTFHNTKMSNKTHNTLLSTPKPNQA